MIYIGHFSFDELGPEKEVCHGYFSCVVEADKADAAGSEFKELIPSLKKMNDIFSNIVTVYIEDIIEIRDVPRRAIITRIQSSVGEFPKSVSRSLPHVESPGINVYGWAPEVVEDEKNGSRKL
ncbi:MAG: hypothetical protein PVG06_13625 [Desulfobacterales bacterium]|jgi:hypothetical protein